MQWWGWLLVSLTALYVYGLRPVARWQLRKVPGDKPKPFIGNLPDVLRLGLHRYQEEGHKKYGGVFKQWGATGKPEVSITDPKLFKQVLNLTNRAPLPGINTGRTSHAWNTTNILSVKDEKWRAMKGAWKPMFYSASLQGFEGFMEECSDKLAQRLRGYAREGGVFDVHSVLCTLTMEVIALACFGVSLDPEECSKPGSAVSPELASKMQGALRTWFDNFGGLKSRWLKLVILFPFASRFTVWLAGMFPDEPIQKLQSAQEALSDFTVDLIAKQRASLGASTNGHSDALAGQAYKAAGRRQALQPGSFLDQMVQAKDRNTGAGFSDLEISMQAVSFLLAGFETTGNLLAYVIYYLAKSPDKAAKLQQEVDAVKGTPKFTTLDMLPYMDAVIKETLRLAPPAPGVVREAAQPMRIAGYDLPRGQAFRVSFWTCHRDPQHWKEPLAWVPERFIEGAPEAAGAGLAAYFPFGDGVRQCAGNAFALQEAKIALFRIVRGFSFRLAPGQDPLPMRLTLTLAPSEGVNVTAHAR